MKPNSIPVHKTLNDPASSHGTIIISTRQTASREAVASNHNSMAARAKSEFNTSVIQLVLIDGIAV